MIETWKEGKKKYGTMTGWQGREEGEKEEKNGEREVPII